MFDNWCMLLLQALLVAEREENDVMKKVHANALETNEELNKKISDADEKIKQFSDTVQRFVALFPDFMTLFLDPYAELVHMDSGFRFFLNVI